MYKNCKVKQISLVSIAIAGRFIEFSAPSCLVWLNLGIINFYRIPMAAQYSSTFMC